MRAVIQRVTSASVTINEQVHSSIAQGLMILLGVEDRDTQADIEWLANKICKMRIFEDDQGLMNRSLLDIQGEALVVSQFTLHAQTKKGNRPSFIKAAKPDVAIPLYEAFLGYLSTQMGKTCGRGEFGADMQVALVNDGPVTITIDTQNRE